MSALLVTNDDGIESPTLIPLARALEPLGEVWAVVPARERSWIGKAISRFERVGVRRVERGGRMLYAVEGTPADCVSIAMHALLPVRPELAVSGINLGLNYGSSFVFSSGTVGGAFEAAIGGVPAIAFSMAIPHDAYGLLGDARAALLGPRCEAAAATAAAITAEVLRLGFPSGVDVLSVNMPADVTPATPRRVTPVTRARYGALFSAVGEGLFEHRFQSYQIDEKIAAGDIATVERGMVSIAALRMDPSAAVPTDWRERLERGAAPLNRNTPGRGE
jgi:5'/3'-nucleotidase